MLKTILGTSGTGKTHYILEQINKRAKLGKYSILIVPEQFSSSAEALLYNHLGDEKVRFSSALSFTALCEKILSEYGGAAEKTLTDAMRTAIVRRATSKLGNSLEGFAKGASGIVFCTMCADAIKELKTAGVSPQDLQAVAIESEQPEKLKDLSIIYAVFNEMCEGIALDSTDRLLRAAEKVKPSFFNEKEIFIDGFDGFTFPEYKMLQALLSMIDCTISLCCDGINDTEGGLGLFSSVKKTGERIRSIAARCNVDVALPLLLEKDYRHISSGIIAACGALSGVEKPISREGVYLYSAENIYDEAKQIASQIAFCEENYGEIAIICRDLDMCEAALVYELDLCNIPYYIDKNITAEFSAPTALVRAILAVADKGINTENVLRLFKTGLCDCNEDLLREVENYAYIWELKSHDWEAPFTLPPSGFGEGLSSDAQKLSALEEMRAAIVPPLQNVVNVARKNTAQNISACIYELMQKLQSEKFLENLALSLSLDKKELQADELYTQWNCVMEILSQMQELFGEDIIKASEYDELFCLLVRSTKIGTLPQEQNSVIITCADRMRLGTPKICFVMGVNEGVFPMEIGYSGLLTHTDREILISRGADMPGGYEKRALLEQMFFYRAVSASSHKIYFSYITEKKLSPPSVPLAIIISALKLKSEKADIIMRCATPAAALDYAAGMQNEGKGDLSALYKAVWYEKSEQQGIKAMHRAQNKSDFDIAEQGLIKSIIGEDLRISPSKTDQYYKCAFAYYLQYILGIRARKKAQLSPLESGSLVHYVMEKALNAAEDFVNMNDESVKILAFSAAEEYIKNCMPDASIRFANLINRIKNAAAKLLIFVRDEQRQSGFRPVALELGIGVEDGIKPITLKLQTGEKVQIVGRIDRVDVMKKDDKSYIRVIDYKTGDKTFDLDEVYCGLNTQMLLYLDTVVKSDDARFENAVSAGVIYLSGDPTPKISDRYDKDEKIYKLDGILLNDCDVLKATDKEATGVFFPMRYKKDGSIYSTKKIADLEKIGRIERHAEDMVMQMAYKLYQGKIGAKPLCNKNKRPCDMCDYSAVCLHENGVNERNISAPENVFEADIAKESV